MKKSKSGYILILVVTLLPLLMLGTKYLLDIQTLWDRKASHTEFLKNNSSKFAENDIKKTEFGVAEVQKDIKTEAARNNLSKESEKKEKNCAKEIALKISEKWNPALTYKQQKQRLLRIADGIYNGSPTYVETLLNKAIPQIDIAREIVNKGGIFNPIKVIKTADTVRDTSQGSSEEQIVYKQITFKRVEQNYDKYSNYDIALHCYDDIYNFLLKKDRSIILPGEDVIDIFCYSREDFENFWGIGWAHYEFWPEEERRIMDSRELKKTKTYDIRKFPDDPAVQIGCENDKIKVTTDKDIGYSVPAECNVDIILTVPTNIEALDIDERNSEKLEKSSYVSRNFTNKVKSAPIYQITRAYRKFLKDHFFYTRGVNVGVIPYGTSTTEKLDGAEKADAINAYRRQNLNSSNGTQTYIQSKNQIQGVTNENSSVYKNYGGYTLNPYYVLKLISDVEIIYEMLGALYPYTTKKDYSNFVFVPVMVADNLLQIKNASKGQPAIDTKYDFGREDASYGRLRTPSSAEKNRKKVLILTVNKPDFVESEKLIIVDKKYKDVIKNLTNYDMSIMGKKATLDACMKLKSDWGNNLRIYLLKFRKQNRCLDQITKTEVTFDYSYLNNCATEDTHQYVKDNIGNQAGLEKALREVAHDIKSWAEYTEAKSITNF